MAFQKGPKPETRQQLLQQQKHLTRRTAHHLPEVCLQTPVNPDSGVRAPLGTVTPGRGHSAKQPPLGWPGNRGAAGESRGRREAERERPTCRGPPWSRSRGLGLCGLSAARRRVGLPQGRSPAAEGQGTWDQPAAAATTERRSPPGGGLALVCRKCITCDGHYL